MPQIPATEPYTLPSAAPYSNHGRTPAAWVMTWGVSLAFLVGGLSLMIEADWLTIVAVVIAVAAVVVSVVMRGMGLGQPAPPPARERERDWYSD
ncbi:HGxxPAAW family protein [Georgenia muralis]|uniref:Uncharacterized protein n=1 Tax=Georgenia muralis TaxID=154117 RepID=A0A3N4Z4C4_9MICO|nr:HGxxPAAW family protein [Georgenia muralis]RPF28149.1 hypothetical protein EDD32_2662 [Georgenia muralis]